MSEESNPVIRSHLLHPWQGRRPPSGHFTADDNLRHVENWYWSCKTLLIIANQSVSCLWKIWRFMDCDAVKDHAASIFRVKVDAATSSETSVSYHSTTRRHNPEVHDMSRLFNLTSRDTFW